MMKLRKWLPIIGCTLLLSICISFIFSAKAFAWVDKAPDCSQRFFGRCLNEGFLTGADGRSCTKLVGISTPACPVGTQDTNINFPLPPNYSYPERAGPLGPLNTWTFPQVNAACGADAYGNTSQCFHPVACDGSASVNDCYADRFLNLLASYLFVWKGVVTSVDPNGFCTPTNRVWPPSPQTGGGQAQLGGCDQYRAEAVGATVIIDTVLGFDFNSTGTLPWNPPLNSPDKFPPILWLYSTMQPQMNKSIDYAINNFDKFSALIHQYDNQGLINWDGYALLDHNHLNSTGMHYGLDNEFFISGTREDARNIIIHDSSGKAIYMINRFCGNIVGVANPLPSLKSDFNFDAYAFPPQPNIDDFGATSVTFFTGIDTHATDFQGSSVTIDNATQFFYVKKRNGTTQPVTGINPALKAGSLRFSGKQDWKNVANLPVGLEAGDQVCALVFISPAEGTWDNGGGGGQQGDGGGGQQGDGRGNSDWRILTKTRDSTTGPICTTLTAKPLLKVFGGDVIAGTGFGQACFAIPDQYIIGFNSENDPYKGAGVQFAAQVGPIQSAASIILDFATGQNLPGVTQRGTDLSFANTIYNNPSGKPGTFGGGFGGTVSGSTQGAAPCAPTDFGPGTVNQTVAPADSTINLSSLLAGLGNISGKQVIYVTDGNVRIDTDVKYGNTVFWSRPSDIPSFTLVVKNGNIFVDPSVTRLDGTYEAAPGSTGNTGLIYTCTPDGTLSAQLYNTCHNQLKVFGSFIAKTIKFQRVGGTLSQSINNPNETYANSQGSEVFVYSPEQWLNSIVPSQTTTYDSINDLPPVL